MGNELLLFAAVGFAISGLDDFVVDILWISRAFWRRLSVYRRFQRTTAATLRPAERRGRLVIFIPAWQEAEVIGGMLKQCMKRWAGHDYRIYVGCYPNDPPTRYVVMHMNSPHIRLVDCPRPGPTTKADCLNAIWAALVSDEKSRGFTAKAIILHDAEDLVHPDELTAPTGGHERRPRGLAGHHPPQIPIRQARRPAPRVLLWLARRWAQGPTSGQRSEEVTSTHGNPWTPARILRRGSFMDSVTN